jgi:hypothetical protein
MPHWKVLERHSRPATKLPVVGIQKKGILSLNQGAVNALGIPEAVEVLYDEEERLFGIRPAESSARTYPLRKMGSSGTYLISAKAIADVLGIDTTIARRYDAKMIEDVLVVDLKTDGIESGRSRR